MYVHVRKQEKRMARFGVGSLNLNEGTNRSNEANMIVQFVLGLESGSRRRDPQAQNSQIAEGSYNKPCYSHVHTF